jgi:hypothetical protein
MTASLAETTRVEQNPNEGEISLFVVAVMLEQAQGVPHHRVGIVSGAQPSRQCSK